MVAVYILIFILGFLTAFIILKADLSFRSDLCNKLGWFYRVLVQWMKLKQHDISIIKYFRDRNVSTVAVYGMKELGQLLCDELKGSEVEVKYAIDKNADHFFSDIDLRKPDDDLEQVDMVVVTVLTKNKEIIENLKKKMNCPVVTIVSVVNAFKVED